jgi:hypothetical protein
MTDLPRAGRRKALADMVIQHFNLELKDEHHKAIAGLAVGEVANFLGNIDRITHALERLAEAAEQLADKE